MDLPDGVHLSNSAAVAKMKVTSTATEVASTSRRTNEGVFRCPGEYSLSQLQSRAHLGGELS